MRTLSEHIANVLRKNEQRRIERRLRGLGQRTPAPRVADIRVRTVDPR